MRKIIIKNVAFKAAITRTKSNDVQYSAQDLNKPSMKTKVH